jgi:hypothetical protein
MIAILPDSPVWNCVVDPDPVPEFTSAVHNWIGSNVCSPSIGRSAIEAGSIDSEGKSFERYGNWV